MTHYLIEGEILAVPTLEEYCRNPAPFEAERAARLAQFNAALAAHDARVRADQERRWNLEGE